MHQFEGLHHVTLVMTDVEQTRHFFGEVLGMREIPVPAFLKGRPLLWYEFGYSQVHIAHPSMNPNLHLPREGEINHFAIRVKSLRAIRERLEAHNWPFVQPDAQVGWPMLMLRDPAGNAIEINAQSLDD